MIRVLARRGMRRPAAVSPFSTALQRAARPVAKNAVLLRAAAPAQLRAAAPAQLRSMSIVQRVQSLPWQVLLTRGAAYTAAGGIVFYVISAGTWRAFHYVVSIPPESFFNWGAAAGAATTLATVGVVALFRRRFFIRPERVHRIAMSAIKSNAMVREQLGGRVASGKLRAYTIETQPIGLFGWNRPSVKMMFMVSGPKLQAMAVVEAEKVPALQVWTSDIDVNLIALDVMTADPSPPIVVAGDAEKLPLLEEMRKFYNVERGPYFTRIEVEAEEEE
jgi:hypothetical protein